MVLYKFTNGTAANAVQVNAAIAEGYTISGLNLARSLIDRAGVWSKGLIDWWGDAYIDVDGRENSVNTSDSSAYFNSDKYNTLPQGIVFGGGGWTYQTSYTLMSTSQNKYRGALTSFTIQLKMDIAGRSGSAQLKIIYDDDSEELTEEESTSSTSYVTLTFTSFDHVKSVKTIEFYMKYDGGTGSMTGGSLTPIGFTTQTREIEHFIPTGTFSDTITTAIGVPLIEDWEEGANIQYKLTNATEDTGWLDSMDSSPEVSSFTAFTSEPTSLIVKLVPKTTSPTAGYPSIRAFTVRCD